MRRGEMQWGIILTIIVMAIIFLWFIGFLNDRNKETTQTIDNLQSCSGFLGTLADEGKCFPDQTCLGATASEANGEGYWQPFGKGYGCKDPTPVCCIKIPDNANPRTAKDIHRVQCLGDLAEGEWAVQTENACEKVTPTLVMQAKANTPLTVYYRPKSTDNVCDIHMQMVSGDSMSAVSKNGCYELRDAQNNNAVALSISAETYLLTVKEKFPNLRTDLSYLNIERDVPITLHSSGGSTSFTLHTTPVNYYCGLSSPDKICQNVKPNQGMKFEEIDGTCKLQDDKTICRFVMTNS